MVSITSCFTIRGRHATVNLTVYLFPRLISCFTICMCFRSPFSETKLLLLILFHTMQLYDHQSKYPFTPLRGTPSVRQLGWRVKRESRGIIAPSRCWASV